MATIVAASLLVTDIAAAIASAVDGDTVQLLPGDQSFSTPLTINKAITLMGNGTVTGNKDSTFTFSGGTTIRDAMPDGGFGLTTGAFLVINLKSGLFTRITGINFENGAGSSTNFNGCIQVNGPSNCNNNAARFRFDNNRIGPVRGVGVFTADILGVIDHCVFQPLNRIPIYIYHQHWGGVDYSDGSWHDPANLGSEKMLFIEDSLIEYPSGLTYAIADAYRGARYSIRNCRINRAWVECHGTDSGGRYRGTRCVDIWGNVFDGTGGTTDYIVNFRSGEGYVHGNRIQNYTQAGFSPKVQMGNYRMHFAFAPFGEADGSSAFDSNNAGNPFVTGTATSGGGLTMTDNTKSWTTNQWAGYSIRNTSISNSVGYYGSQIISNTATTITYEADGGYAVQVGISALAFVAGNHYEINLVDQVLDGCGRGQGTQLSGATPTAPSPNDQVTTPIRVWGNTAVNSPALTAQTQDSTIRSGEHYITSAPVGYTAYDYPHPLTGSTASSVSTLSALTASQGIISPSFASGIITYTASVANGITSMTVTPTVTESHATVTVNGTSVASGVASGSIGLSVGANAISIVVTAQDTTTTTYTLTVTRASGASTNANLSGLAPGAGTLAPTFASGTTSYTIALPNATTSYRYTPTSADSGATITVNGTPCVSGAPSQYMLLPTPGDYTHTIVVTAADGSTTKTYTVVATRAAAASSTNSALSAMTVSAGALSPSFSAGTTSYALPEAASQASITVTPTASDSVATITVNGVPCTTGSASASIPIPFGSSFIIILVRAQDGVTTTSYSLAVSRPLSTDSTLSGMAISGLTLVPVFASGTTGYTATAASSVAEVTLTPTSTNSYAAITVNGVAVTGGSPSGSIPLALGVNVITVVVTAQDGS